jgi:sec-independent protein translocase protein TatA
MGLDNPIHILFLLVLLLLVFGAKRLPEMGRSLGSGMRGFKDSINGVSAHAEELPQPTPAMQAAASENQAPPVVAGGREQRT